MENPESDAKRMSGPSAPDGPPRTSRPRAEALTPCRGRLAGVPEGPWIRTELSWAVGIHPKNHFQYPRCRILRLCHDSVRGPDSLHTYEALRHEK